MTTETENDKPAIETMTRKELGELQVGIFQKMQALQPKLCKQPTEKIKKQWDTLNAEFECYDRALKFQDLDTQRRTAHEKQNAGLSAAIMGSEVAYANREAENERGESPTVRRATPDKKDTILFRDLQSGRTVRTLSRGERLSSESPQGDIGELIYFMLTGNTDRLRTFSQVGASDQKGGYLLSPEIGAGVIDLAREASVALRAGAQTVNMATSELALAKIDTDPVPAWLPESSPATTSSAVFGRITLRAKTLRCHIPISLELIEDASNAPSVIRTVLQRKLGAELDKAILTGDGAVGPTGITNAAGTNSLDFGGSVTNTNGWNKLSQAVEKVLVSNYDGTIEGLSLVAHPTAFRLLDVLQDGQNQPQAMTPWLAQVQKFATTTMTAPSDGNAIIGDFRQVLIGLRTSGVQIRIVDGGTTTAGDNVVDSYSRTIIASWRGDVALLQPGWHCVITNIDV